MTAIATLGFYPGAIANVVLLGFGAVGEIETWTPIVPGTTNWSAQNGVTTDWAAQDSVTTNWSAQNGVTTDWSDDGPQSTTWTAIPRQT